MRAPARLPAMRRRAVSRMTSRVTVKRQSGTTTGPDGYEVPAWSVVYTDLPFRSSGGGVADGGSRGVVVGGVAFEEATGVGHFPHPSPLLRDNDIVQVTSGEWSGDFYRIVSAIRYDQHTARRLPIQETAKPDGWDA